MIAWLKGKVVTTSDQSVVLDVRGVGYELLVSGDVLANSPKKGDELELIVYTDVKENAISLFGFSDRYEKEVFLMLRQTKGVGSKLAMAVISTIGARNVLQAIGLEDVSSLTRVSGVGKRSAERMIVELREKVGSLVGLPAKSASTKSSGLDTATSLSATPASDAILALEKLGFANQNASKVVKEIVAADAKLAAGDILRKALAAL